MLGCAAPASAGRIRGLPSYLPAFDNGPGNMLAGEAFVYATPRRVFGWPASGGPREVIARVPRLLRPADNELVFGTGFVSVAAAQPGRIALIRDRGPAFFPKFQPQYGKQLVVGPPDGPFVDPAGCREATGGPVSLDGDRIAYRAAPSRRGCPDSVVSDHSIVVRDLADGGRVEAVVRLREPERTLKRVELAGPFVAFSARAGALRETLSVVDLRSGRVVTRLPSAIRTWALDTDGRVVAADLPRLRCNRAGMRIHAPGDPIGVPVDGRPCDGLLDFDAGAVLFAERRGVAYRTIRLDMATGRRRLLATTAGELLDADDQRLAVADPTCSTEDVRTIALSATPAVPAETERCLRGVHVPRRIRAGEPIRVRVVCPRGCHLEVNGRVNVDGLPFPLGSLYHPVRSTTITVEPHIGDFEPGQVVRLRVVSDEPALGRRTRRFVVRVR